MLHYVRSNQRQLSAKALLRLREMEKEAGLETSPLLQLAVPPETENTSQVREEPDLIMRTSEDAAKAVGQLSMEFLAAPKKDRNFFVLKIKQATERLEKLYKTELLKNE
jgi:hypothetical protein